MSGPGGVCSRGGLVLGHVCSGGGGVPAPGEVWSWGVLARGVPGPRGCAWSWGVPGGHPPGTATAAGGTHPTGMHSCCKEFFFSFHKNDFFLKNCHMK